MMSLSGWLRVVLAVAACLCAAVGQVGAATYYVDYEGGSDAGDGGAAKTAFKHCPADAAATGAAAKAKLQPGDTVVFRGGVHYFGSIEVRASGEKGKPITFDGNSAGAFGRGRAIVDGGVASGNVVTEHYGMHANALTFYLGCKNLLIEGNRTRDSNIGLTIQDAENVVIRNNIFDGGGKGACAAIWTATPFRNVKFLHNLLIRCTTKNSWEAGLFSNNRKPEGLLVRNNVIDGLSGSLPGEFSHNIYTRWGPNQKDHKLGPGEIHQPELKMIFVDPVNGDFRLRPGGPAVDAGADAGVGRDITGAARPAGKTPDIGPYEYAPSRK